MDEVATPHDTGMESLYFATADDHNVLVKATAAALIALFLMQDTPLIMGLTIPRPTSMQTYSTKIHRM